MLTETSAFEAARAQYPVLERVAYLNAGSSGPLATATVEAMKAEEDRNLVEGRMGRPYIERYLALRAELREILGGLVGAAPELVALTASTTDSCNVVLAGLDIGPSDEIVTTTDEHFGHERGNPLLRPLLVDRIVVPSDELADVELVLEALQRV